jgi:hypothetical protein
VNKPGDAFLGEPPERHSLAETLIFGLGKLGAKKPAELTWPDF